VGLPNPRNKTGNKFGLVLKIAAMNTLRLATVLGLGALLGCSTIGAKHRPYALFNERNLAGWVVMHGGTWTVQDGVLTGRNGTNWSTNPERSGSWLRTEKQYADFVLEFDYAINEGGNSGVFLRSALDKNPAFTGYEMQILADHGRPPTKHSAGSLYDLIAPKKNMSKPAGEWNQVRISAHGPNIQITINGEKVIETDDNRSLRGYIGLQNHDGHAVARFRNVLITEL
jgi:hypothetical protein